MKIFLKNIQKIRGVNRIDSEILESLYAKFSKQKKASQFSLGYIPNLASLLKARKMHDGFGPQMGGSGVRSKKFKDSGSFLEYQGNEIEFIQSMRKGDANMLFDRFAGKRVLYIVQESNKIGVLNKGQKQILRI